MHKCEYEYLKHIQCINVAKRRAFKITVSKYKPAIENRYVWTSPRKSISVIWLVFAPHAVRIHWSMQSLKFVTWKFQIIKLFHLCRLRTFSMLFKWHVLFLLEIEKKKKKCYCSSLMGTDLEIFRYDLRTIFERFHSLQYILGARSFLLSWLSFNNLKR